MCTAGLLQLRDGRLLAYQRYGDLQGRPLFFFHGFPGSRLQAALLHEHALAAKICIVAPDRPGFGLSTPSPSRTILSWPDDVAQLADDLGYARFGVIGVSCGGPYALACAHRLADRIDYVGTLAGMGPMDVRGLRDGQLRFLRVLFGLARVHPRLISPLLWLDRRIFRGDAKAAIRAIAPMLTPPDRSLLQNDAIAAARFAASLAEAYRQGIEGAMREAHLIAKPRGFALADIRIPVHVYQGDQDRNVPPQMGRYVASTLPYGRFRSYPDEGHLSIVLRAFGDCVADFNGATA